MKSSTHFPCLHPRTPENTYAFIKDGYRNTRCKICCNERWKKARALIASQKQPEREKTPKYRGKPAGRILFGRRMMQHWG